MQLPWLYCVSMTMCECFFVQKNIRVFLQKNRIYSCCVLAVLYIMFTSAREAAYFVILLCLMPDNFTRLGIIWHSAGSQKIF
jgi:hypothetical protein